MNVHLHFSYLIAYLFSFYVCNAIEFSANGETPQYWNNLAKQDLLKSRNKHNIAVAKNVILFLGDGMGISTVTAARILQGQLRNKTGEENFLSFEQFPNAGLSKTYNQDHQTPDSAGTATAFLCGVKTNMGMVGVDARTHRGNCESQKGGEIQSILDWSLAAGKSVGLVTTTRVTHATPSSAYAHSADRNWEGDNGMPDSANGCKDIARQLVEDNPRIQVILGGGRTFFMQHDQIDPETGLNNDTGRLDGRDLIKAWANEKQTRGVKHRYVWNASSFDDVDPLETDYLLGLFNNADMQFEVDRLDKNKEPGGEPPLANMTEKAIKILNKNPNGFFLLVEGGLIDYGHHYGKAITALTDTIAFSDAVAKGAALTSEEDTLIITTADHSHTMVIAGYPSRGNPIGGKADDGKGGLQEAQDKQFYTTLLYATGPGYILGERPNITDIDTEDPNYLQQAAVPADMETHGGEDVGIYARGPMSHLISGVHEQHYIAHVMAYASCVGAYATDSECARADVNNMKSQADKCVDRLTSANQKMDSFILLIIAMTAFPFYIFFGRS